MISAKASARIPIEHATLARIGWLIALRWLFVLVILIVPWFVRFLLVPSLHLPAFMWTGVILACINLLFRIFYQRLIRVPAIHQYPLIRGLIQVQIVLDWCALLVLIHFTGGVESPLIHFFMFHLALSAIFLESRFTLFALFVVMLATTGLFVLEAKAWITPVSLPGLTWSVRQGSLPFVLNFSFWFFSTLSMLAILIGSVMRTLRRREKAALQTRSRLEEANQRVTRISEDRVRLMHTMGHELRSPIAATESMLAALDMAKGDDLPQDVQRIHGRIRHRLGGLTALISELLDLAESQKGVMAQPRMVNLCAMVATCLEDHRAAAEDRQITLDRTCYSKGDICLSADPGHLRRIFENLISNAVKYSSDGGEVTVVSKIVDEKVYVSISDTGIGIAPDQIDRLFDEFYRTPQSRRHTDKGTGLGLAITRDLIHSMDGSLKVESELQVGSVFTLCLPLYPSLP